MNGLSLGIPGVGAVSPGTHFCALYSGPAERDRLFFPFLEEGLRHGDKCLCLIDDVEPALVRDRAVGQHGPVYSRRSAQPDVATYEVVRSSASPPPSARARSRSATSTSSWKPRDVDEGPPTK